MRYITVYLSNDGKGWSRVTGQITASITSPGGMGTQIEFPGGGRTARWVRVHTQGNAAYYRGVGEIEIYEQPVTGSPQGLTCLAQSDGSVKLEWKAMQKGDLVAIRRQKHTSHGSLYNYPEDHTTGTLIHQSDQGTSSFVDKTAVPNKRWYYAAFAYSKSTGWSHIEWPGLDNCLPGAANPNLAQDKRIFGPGIFNHNSIYGHAHYATDGNRGAPAATTDGNFMKQFGYKITMEIDLKRVYHVHQFGFFQAGDRHFAMNEVNIQYKTSLSSGYRNLGNSKLVLAEPAGLASTPGYDHRMRYIKITVSRPAAYYYGIGEIEIYETKRNDYTTLQADPNGDTGVNLKWSKPSSSTEIVVRRTTVKGDAWRDAYPKDQDYGTEVYRGKGTSFTDVDLNKGVWYYYAGYTHSAKEGWSWPQWSAFSPIQVGTSNNNINVLRGREVRTNADVNLIYGEAYRTTDGNKGRGCATTDWRSVNRGWRPGGSKFYVEIDLKRTRAVSRAVAYQTGDKHFHNKKMRIYTTTSSTPGNWKSAS